MYKGKISKESYKELLDSERKIRKILETTQDGFCIVGKNQRFIDANNAFCKMLGYTKEEILNLTVSDIDFYESSEDVKKRLDRIKKNGHDFFETKHINKDGKIFDMEVSISCLNKEPLEYFCFLRDVTSKRKDKQKIIDMKQRLENIIEGTNVGTWEWNIKKDNTVVNKKYAEMLGYTLEEISPMNIETWEKLMHSDDLKRYQKKMRKIWNKEIEYYDIEIRAKHKNGKWKWINSRGKVTRWSEDRTPLIMSGTHTDITEKKQEQKQIEYLSFHDPLTGLYNRRYMEDSIKRLDTDRNIPFSIIAADVDGLKLTNDAYGHEMGDKLLITAAEILKKSCRKEDIVCRVGGDEFLILLPNIDENKVNEIIKRIAEESQNTNFDSVIVSLAIGYSTKNKKEKSIMEVYKEADNNMYKNKLKFGRIIRNKNIEKVLANVNKRYENEKIHNARVSKYCESIARAMNLSNKEVEDAKLAGKLHDIGKIVVPPKILKKESKLTDEEREELKKHSTISYHLLKSVDKYSRLSEVVLYHHERLDGSGYPEGLKEDEIPLLSKIIAVADTYESMTAGRPHQKKKTKAEAVKELKKQSGTKFDKYIVDVFINKVI